MLYRVMLREEAARALREGGTIAGPNVWTARSWPIKANALPSIQLQCLADVAESQGRAAPGFVRTAGLLISARVGFRTAPDGSSAEGENLVDLIAEQIETTLMQDTALQRLIQQVAAIDTEVAFESTGGAQIAVARMRFDLEYGETFMPSGVPLAAINQTILSGSGIELAQAVTAFPLPAAPPPGPSPRPPTSPLARRRLPFPHT